MKKIIYMLAFSIMLLFTVSCSFETYATTQDDMYIETDVDIIHSNVDFNVVFRYGTPYYYNGSILYYLYNGIYYYPYYYDNYWYLRAYRRPFPYTHYRPYFRPHRYDYRFDRGYRNPRSWNRYTPSGSRNNYRPSNHTYNHSMRQPNTPSRSIGTQRGGFNNSTRGGSFGGSRGGGFSPLRGGSAGGSRGRR